MVTSGADFMVANSSESLYSALTPHYIMNHNHEVFAYSGKEETATAIVHHINQLFSFQ